MKHKRDFAGPFRHVVGILFLVIISLTCIQVICRYLFNNSLVWSEELVRFLIIWMCMIGAAVCSYDDSHMTINTVLAKFPVKAQFAIYTLRQIMIVAFSAVSAIASFKLIRAALHTSSGALQIPMGIWRLGGTVGLGLVAIYTVLRFWEDYGRFRRGEFLIRDSSED